MQHPTEPFMRAAIALARKNIDAGGRPFGAVLVRDGQIIARGVNETNQSHDPTAHAELLALRYAGERLSTPDLSGSIMYASGHPCPMCMAAMHLAGVQTAYFAYSNEDGEEYGLSTGDLYKQMAKAPQHQRVALRPFRPSNENGLYAEWKQHG